MTAALVVERAFVKGSNNLLSVTLTEDGSPITGAWTELDIYVGATPFIIHRTSNENGVSLVDGVLVINPGALTEDLASLSAERHQAYVRVKSVANPDGVYFGAEDSTTELWFSVSDPPG